jgi:hypothetical protein
VTGRAGRVVDGDDGRLLVIELELIEPPLFPASANRRICAGQRNWPPPSTAIVCPVMNALGGLLAASSR